MRRASATRRAPIMLTPLVDMFTILLVFLLMNYSTGGDLMYMIESILMPESISRVQLEPAVEVAVATDRVYVDGDLVLDDLSPWYAGNELLIPQLYEALKTKSAQIKQKEQLVSLYRFSGKIVIQGDRALPFKLLKKIMYTADRADFTNISLAVLQKGQS